jgi:hypothetical protein
MYLCHAYIYANCFTAIQFHNASGCFGLELVSQQIPAMEEFSSIKADALSIQQYVNVGTM